MSSFDAPTAASLRPPRTSRGRPIPTTYSDRSRVPAVIRLGGKPFESDFSVYLDEINETDNNFILRAAQVINKEQLTNATFDYMVSMAKAMKKTPPKRSDISDIENETLTASRVHGSGWIIYSVQTVTVTSGPSSNVEERIIEIQ